MIQKKQQLFSKLKKMKNQKKFKLEKQIWAQEVQIKVLWVPIEKLEVWKEIAIPVLHLKWIESLNNTETDLMIYE